MITHQKYIHKNIIIGEIMNRENTEMEAEKLLDNIDLSLDDEEQQSDEDTTLTHPELMLSIMLKYTMSVLLMKLSMLQITTLFILKASLKGFTQKMAILTGSKFTTILLFHT